MSSIVSMILLRAISMLSAISTSNAGGGRRAQTQSGVPPLPTGCFDRPAGFSRPCCSVSG
jgi:hypothetical protein